MRIFLAILFALFTVGVASAQTTRTAATCNQPDVNTTIGLSSPGDTVIIPNGSCTWTAGVQATGIAIQGQSVGGVTITNNNPTGCATGCVTGSFLFYLTTSTAGHAGLSNIVFNPGTATGSHMHVADGAGCGTGSQPTNCVVLVHDITANVPNFQIFNAIDHHATGGVYWNIHLASTNNLGGACGGPIIGSQSGSMVVEEPNLSWDNPSTFGTLDINGTINVYIEDSDFTYIYQMPDADNNARVVLRHNVWTNAQGLTHGTTSPQGGRFIEAYNDTFINNNVNADISRWFWLRAGAMIFANDSIQAAGNSCHPNRSSLQMVVENAQGVGGHGCALAGQGFHQPGSGGSAATQSPSFVGISNNTLTPGYSRDDPNQLPFPIYFFNNSGTGNAANLITTNEGSTGGACGNTNPFTGALYSTNDFLFQNRDYYTDLSSPSNFQGIQKGLLSARPTVGYPGVGYYATDTTTLYSISNSSGKGYSFTPRGSVAQNPMVDDGGWVQGHTTGLDWGDFQTVLTGNMATGTVLSPTCGTVSTGCTDSTAVRTGSWSNDQQVEATVRAKNQSCTKFEEIELRLRTTITAHSITGYEFNFAICNNGSQYAQIVRWNGPLGNFTLLDSRGSPTVPAMADGAVIKATAVGNQLCTFENNVQLFCVTDSTFPSGAPGIGAFDQAGVIGDFADFGLTNFKAASTGAGSAVWQTVWTPFAYPHPLRSGTTAPSISISPNPITFSNQLVGTTSAGITATITNGGNADEILATPFFTITGTNATDFARSGGTCTSGATLVQGGGNCTIILTFTPAAIGARTGTLNINGTASTSAPLSGTGIQPVATPTFSPVAGTYGAPQTISVLDSTGGATLCYTIDGSNPTADGNGHCTHGTTYAGTFVVSVTTTVKAMGTEAGFTDSAVASATYVIQLCSNVNFSPSGNIFTNSVLVTLTSGCTSIIYTIDGSTPTETACSPTNGILYTVPFSLISTGTVKAISCQSGFVDSPVVSQNYTITQALVPSIFTMLRGGNVILSGKVIN